MDLWFFWLILIIILVIAEISTVNLVSIWFITSGIISLILSFFVKNFIIQFAVFVILGIILLVTTKPILEKTIASKKEKTNLDRVIGMSAIVTEPIKKNIIGEVKVDGKRWSAISSQKIEIDEEVIVDAIDGVKLIVRKKEE